VSADRVLTEEEFADAGMRLTAERQARAAVATLIEQLSLDYNAPMQPIWIRVETLSGSAPRPHHFELRAHVRPAARWERGCLHVGDLPANVADCQPVQDLGPFLVNLPRTPGRH
jgi:hypothetical protein